MKVDSNCAAGSLLYNEADGKDVREGDGDGTVNGVMGGRYEGMKV